VAEGDIDSDKTTIEDGEEDLVHSDNGDSGRFHGLKLRKGIYIVPNLITAAAFFCGFYAIIASIHGHFYQAAWAIIFAMFFDGLDGRIARAMRATTQFGVEFDSLSDLISFGAAPAILMYNWVLQPFGRIGWMAAFLFALCGALRLARFNTQASDENTSKDRFVGLPIPPAAGLLACTVLLTRGALEIEKAPAVLIVITVYLLALLMVSNIPYHNFKQLDLRRRRPFHILLAVILFVFTVAQFPHYMLFAMAVTYALHGPVEYVWKKRKLGEGLLPFSKTK
jgi:CDP-diacylglycerol--serine O-phosphatidyltransferase